MSGFIGVNLINFKNLTPAQKNRLLRKLKSRKQAVQAQLSEINKSLKLVQKKLKK